MPVIITPADKLEGRRPYESEFERIRVRGKIRILTNSATEVEEIRILTNSATRENPNSHEFGYEGGRTPNSHEFGYEGRSEFERIRLRGKR
jgi:hypothetical protein